MTEKLPDTVLFDKRLIKRHIERGIITRDEVDKRLAETEDLTEQADFQSLDELMYGESEKKTEPAAEGDGADDAG